MSPRHVHHDEQHEAYSDDNQDAHEGLRGHWVAPGLVSPRYGRGRTQGLEPVADGVLATRAGRGSRGILCGPMFVIGFQYAYEIAANGWGRIQLILGAGAVAVAVGLFSAKT
jgi:hypothetical protein